MNPYSEFGVVDKKAAKWTKKAQVDPEYDPRFGTGYKRGFQIDPKPFQMQQKADKKKAKMARKS